MQTSYRSIKRNFLKSFNTLFILISLVFSLCSPNYLHGETITGKVVSVADGDTITILNNGLQLKLRLYGIDAPEKNQPFGQKAHDFTASMVAGRQITVEQKDTDRYGRTVAMVYVDGINLNEQIVKQGYGWVYRQYCKDSICNDWLKLESNARESLKGLWAESNPIPPWEFRQGQRTSGNREHDFIVLPSTSTVVQNVPSESGSYHGNRNSHVFHSSACKDFNCPNCTVVFNSTKEATGAGFRPHKECVR